MSDYKVGDKFEIKIAEVYESNAINLLPIVEQWTKEHPKVTNLDHVAKELERIGYKVDKKVLRKTCPVHKSYHFTAGACNDYAAACKNCLKWWDEEYKEQKE